jgi:hypothetical protein
MLQMDRSNNLFKKYLQKRRLTSEAPTIVVSYTTGHFTDIIFFKETPYIQLNLVIYIIKGRPLDKIRPAFVQFFIKSIPLCLKPSKTLLKKRILC